MSPDSRNDRATLGAGAIMLPMKDPDKAILGVMRRRSRRKARRG